MKVLDIRASIISYLQLKVFVLIVFCCGLASPRLEASYEKFENWGFEQGGGFRQGNFIGADKGIIVQAFAWDDTRQQIAVVGARGKDWAVRTYKLETDGPVLLNSWDLDQDLLHATATAVQWHKSTGLLLCGVEHVKDNKMAVGLQVLDPGKPDQVRVEELKGWETIVGISQDPKNENQMIIAGSVHGSGKCAILDLTIQSNDKEQFVLEEFVLDKMSDPQTITVTDELVWVGGDDKGKSRVCAYNRDGDLLDDHELFDDNRAEFFISKIAEVGGRVFVTGRTSSKNAELENFFLFCFEFDGEKIRQVWTVRTKDQSNKREWGTTLAPLVDGGVLVGGNFRGSWLLGQGEHNLDLAMLISDEDGEQNFDSFLARYDKDGNLMWAQNSGYAGNDFLVDIIAVSNNEAFILGTRNNDGGIGPFLEKIKTEGNANKNAPRISVATDDVVERNEIHWELSSNTLRLGEHMDSEFFTARGFGNPKFRYELNGAQVNKGKEGPLFDPGEIEFHVKLLRGEDEVEKNSSTQTLLGLRGRPVLDYVIEHNQTEIKVVPRLAGLHTEHLADSIRMKEINDRITVEISPKRGIQSKGNGRVQIETSFIGFVDGFISFAGDSHYEATDAPITLLVKDGKVTDGAREGKKVTIRVKDLDGWQDTRFVNAGEKLMISATEGFGKNRKFKQWVQFSEKAQKLRTAEVLSPFNITTAVRADEDMTLFARYNYSFLGTAINGYLSGARVFLDLNLNGRFDEEEPTGFSEENGGFEIEVEEELMQQYDKNQNGVLDASEAMIVVMGGMDKSSRLPLRVSYRCPPSYKVVTSVSTLISEFLKEGYSEEDAERIVSESISLPTDINLTDFEPINSVITEGVKARDFVLRATQLSNIINEGSRYLKAKSGNKVSRVKSAQKIVSAIKDKILENSSRRSTHDVLDLNDPTTLLSVISSADAQITSEDLAEEATEEETDTSVRAELTESQPDIAAVGNEQMLNEIVTQVASANESLENLAEDPNVSPTEFKSLASASQSILDELGEITSNTLFEEEVTELSNLSGDDSLEAEDLIERSEEVESLADIPSAPAVDSSTLASFSPEVLEEVSSQNETNVYAPVLTGTSIFSPDDFSETLTLGSLSAYDPEGGDLTYSIVGQNPDYDLDDNPMLEINSTSGQINIQDYDDLQLMTVDTVSPIVRFTDPGGLFRDEEVGLNIAEWTYFAGRLQIPDLSLSVPENLPVGTIIYSFETTDVHDGSIEYELVNGSGDTHNDLFTIDSAGSLKTATVFDYETGEQQLEIRLQAIDSQFNSVEESLTILVSDLLLPNVQTGEANVVDGQLQFEASMTSFGPLGDDLTLGFYLSGEDIVDLNASGVTKVSSSSNTDSTFNALASIDLSGGTYHYLAFAESGEGVRYGAEKTFVLPRITAGESWSDGSLVANYDNWWESDWFGLYNTEIYPWIYHQNLGWTFVNVETERGAWLYHQKLGWMWTQPGVFPHIYVSKGLQWSYLNTDTAKATLYDYELKEWFEADKTFQITGTVNVGIGEISGLGSYYRWDKVTLEANPASDYNFAGWSGDITSMDSVVELEAIRDINVQASFLAIPTESSSSDEVLQNIQNVLNKMDHLSETEKQKSIAELLIYGTSPTSGLSIVKSQ